LVNNASNWITQDTANPDQADGVAPDVPFDATPFTNDPHAQFVAFSAGSLAVSHPEGDSGTTAYTFTVERTGDNMTGALDFSGTIHLTGPLHASDFGGTLPTSFNGTIADGAASATVTITVSGDTTFEPNEQFALTLQSASNPGVTTILGVNDTATG